MRRSKRYIKIMTAHTQHAGRLGGRSKPKNEVEVGILSLGVQSQMTRSLERLLDIARFDVSFTELHNHSSIFA